MQRMYEKEFKKSKYFGFINPLLVVAVVRKQHVPS